MRITHTVTHRAVVRTCSPLRDWTFRIAGLCLFLGVFALGGYLEDPLVDAELPEAAYQRGVSEGRRQMLLAYAGRNREAYQAGMDEAFQRCTASGTTLGARK